MHSGRWKEWRKAVFERDDYICQDCREDNRKKLRGHHKMNRKDYPELLFVVSNGVTLCISCHAKRHFPKGSQFGINQRERGL